MEKKDTNLVELVGIVVIATFVAPIVVGAMATVITYGYTTISNGINKAKYDKKIKKGLKDGSIVEIDGDYYERKVTDTNEEA